MSSGIESIWVKSWQDWEMWDDVAAFSFYECVLNPSGFTAEELKTLEGFPKEHICVNIVMDEFSVEVEIDGEIAISKKFEINPEGTATRLNRVERLLGNVDSALPTGLESFFDGDEDQTEYYEGR